MPRKNQKLFEGLIVISSKLPWWAGVSLAVISYLMLSSYASQEVVITHSAGISNAVESMLPTMLKTMASIAQYILPLAFLIGAGASAYQRFVRSDLLQRAASNEGESAVNSMSWREFEKLVGEAFRKQGYRVTETADGADGGIDLVLRKEGETILVQCKHWKTRKVGVKVVRELYGILIDKGADEVNIVCSGDYTDDAKSFVKNKPIHLIDGNQLLSLVQNAT